MILALLGLAVAGFFVLSGKKTVHHGSDVTEEVSGEALEDTVTPVVESLTLEQKVGQMLLLGIWNPEHKAGQKRLIERGIIGSVIVMNANISTKDATRTHIARLQEAVPTSTPPLLVAVDQEGGTVSRFEYDDFDLTAQPEIEDTDEAREVAARRGKELADLGVNVNFAPVLEYITDPDSFLYDRTFRVDEKSEIAPLASAMVRGYQRAGVAATVKHFPGHKSGSVDSHKNLPSVDDISYDELTAYTSPFITVLDEARPDMVMTAHVLFPAIDEAYPATLSPEIIDEFLRKSLGFTRVIITDDMNMGAITNGFGRTEAALQAVKAGNDILLYVATPTQVEQVHAAIVEAVKRGEIPEERIDESVKRIIALKQKYAK